MTVLKPKSGWKTVNHAWIPVGVSSSDSSSTICATVRSLSSALGRIARVPSPHCLT